ncbi:hypothetical protein NA57DRAFT_65047 [Rhizodiscina lignyota]|uniref:SPRY domain-containing protein n=1 Tax=Rhizodiscina lignyota TaxID=1504668 RepID=A0A9P4IGH7_9PEZI|nr:hypothetical protein NA57DRAFT_65047 [Rhizodiscina lignyota]
MSDKYQPPAGPPPSWRHGRKEEEYPPPPGPPPSNRSHQSEGYAPPSEPPPSWHGNQSSEESQPPPAYHDWTVIPDTALLPPPPQLTNELSPTANASEAEGEAAYKWGLQNPLWKARPLPQAQLRAIHDHAHTLVKPQGFTGDVLPQSNRNPGTWHAKSRSGTRDSCLQTSLPLYSALNDSPLETERPKTIYFELHVLGVGDSHNFMRARRQQTLEEADAGIAIGFFAPPYPGWRLPGWQRGSLAVHGDDGRRYVNDTFGGVDFTNAFKVGETVGIGMTWKAQMSDAPPTYGGGQRSPLAVDIFFTRNGHRDGGWNLHEEMDAERSEGGTMGLDGDYDIFGAVGIFGAVEVEVRFNPADWMFKVPPDKSW